MPRDAATPVASAPVEATYAALPMSAVPAGPLGDEIRFGHALLVKTNQLLPEYATSSLACASCHLDEGRKLGAAALLGVYQRFPKYMERTGAVITLQDRINYCFTRSLAGNRLPADSKEMTAIIAYLAFLSEGAPARGKIAGADMPVLTGYSGDATRGEQLYTAKTCIACHGPDGGGVPTVYPALWGAGAYSVGASMAREERAASFIYQFMPQTTPGTLTIQEAFDLSAFINSRPRPDSPGKENDWPKGGAPADVPYATSGHEAYKPPAVLPRKTRERAVVPPPSSVLGAQATR
jgi:thiosulfate dehydrogenase